MGSAVLLGELGKTCIRSHGDGEKGGNGFVRFAHVAFVCG